ncbi:MAG TPA: PAS domain-containing protein [Rhizomicrobium sp.]|nr:PAS domain-containing protein [Rhizomicrobium sp.]
MALSAFRAAIDAFNANASAHDWPFFAAPAEGFARPELAAALALWREKAGGRVMPDRADMTARAMKPFMANMSLLQAVTVDGRPDYRIRLHGRVLASYIGDYTGRTLREAMQGGGVPGYTALCDLAVLTRMPLRVTTSYRAPEISYLTGESLIAPLAVPGSSIPMILSVTYAGPRGKRSAADLMPRIRA